jgi:hypothetical protein
MSPVILPPLCEKSLQKSGNVSNRKLHPGNIVNESAPGKETCQMV